MIETGRAPQPEKIHNIVRDTYRRINHWGIGWKVPLDVVNFECGDHDVVPVHYLHPRKLLQYLAENKADVIHGGNPDAIPSFWSAYEKYHPSHEAFISQTDFSRLIPVNLHGDEGRGKRRSQTTVVSFECLLGMAGKPVNCRTCKPSSLPEYHGAGWNGNPVCEKLVRNMKGHSFLQHFPLFVIPGTWAKTYKVLTLRMLERVARDFHDLFHNGFQTTDGARWHVAVVGKKGDLKWFAKICRLTRGYENKSRKTDIPHCHCCLAGSPGLPAEDLGPNPCWLQTIYAERPWRENDQPSLDLVPFDVDKPEFLYKHDPFHTLRLGIYRHFCGSIVFMLLRLDFFGPGNVPTKLEVAHGYFRLWQAATGKHAALRSFTTHLLSYKTAKSYPWFNVKGSDCGLLLLWLRTMLTGLLQQDEGLQQNRQALEIALATCEVAIDFYDMMVKHNLFLNRNCASSMVEKGQSFLNGYCFLANFALTNEWCLFAIVPKAHFMRHMIQELEAQLASQSQLLLNPLCWDCSQNEDFIGRICRMGRKIDARVMGHRLLENYLIKAGILHGREVRKRKQLKNKFVTPGRTSGSHKRNQQIQA
eukprot:Skav231842  [mRNA]  locus=scaffold2215:283811:285574:+ [translate_table: standard]